MYIQVHSTYIHVCIYSRKVGTTASGGRGGESCAIERREREKSADVRTNRALYIIVRCIPSYNILRRRAGYIVIL